MKRVKACAYIWCLFLMQGLCGQSLDVMVHAQLGTSKLTERILKTDTLKRSKVSPLPFLITQYHHSKIPFPTYDGGLAPARKYSMAITTGFQLQHKSLELQFAPSFTTYTQSTYEGFPQRNSNILWSNRYAWWNQIDQPENVVDSLNGYQLGQSYIGLNMEVIRVKVSTENLWWGPGKYNALVLSSNAAGFPHLSISFVDPLSVGPLQISFQSITGLLQNSGLFPPDTSYAERGNKLFVPKPDVNRMLSGLHASFRLSFLPTISFGVNNVTQQYTSLIETNDYVSSISSLFLRREGLLDNVHKQQLRSFFIDWQLPEAELALYIERVRQNPALSFFDANSYPDQSTGFLIGLEKSFSIAEDRLWVLNTEITKMSQNPVYVIENGTSIYLDQHIRQGYTHRGEVLGSALGSGSNQQLFALRYETSKRMIGFEFQRLVRDLDFYYFAFNDNRDFRRYWVDIGTAFTYQHAFETALIHLEARHIYSINYQWEHAQDPDELYFAPGRDLHNWQLQCHVLIPLRL